MAWDDVRPMGIQNFTQYVRANLPSRAPKSANARYWTLVRSQNLIIHKSTRVATKALTAPPKTPSGSHSAEKTRFKREGLRSLATTPCNQIPGQANENESHKIIGSNDKRAPPCVHESANNSVNPSSTALQINAGKMTPELELAKAQLLASLLDKAGATENTKQSVNHWLSAYASRV